MSGPHGLAEVWVWTSPVALLIAADRWGPGERRRLPAEVSRRVFDGLMLCLGLLQLANVLAMGWMVSRLEWSGTSDILSSLANLVVLRILCGTNACCAVIAPAHELIHRRSRWQRRLGRCMLMSVFYDHFCAAHRLGHHARLGTPGDPSSARIDESFEAFFWRSFCGQWKIAWKNQPRSTLMGVGVELILMALYWVAFGGLALFAWFYVNGVAVRLLEAVNYFQHLGLTQESGRPDQRAWHCDSAISLFMFLGLNRHADHHRRPGVAFTELEDVSGELRLPFGYLVTAIWVKNASRSYRAWALKEMSREAGVPSSSPATGNALALQS